MLERRLCRGKMRRINTVCGKPDGCELVSRIIHTFSPQLSAADCGKEEAGAVGNIFSICWMRRRRGPMHESRLGELLLVNRCFE